MGRIFAVSALSPARGRDDGSAELRVDKRQNLKTPLVDLVRPSGHIRDRLSKLGRVDKARRAMLI